MAPPQTPHRQTLHDVTSSDLPSMTPTKERVEKWRATPYPKAIIDRVSKNYNLMDTEIMNPELDEDQAAGIIHGYHVRLKEAIKKRGLNPDILDDEAAEHEDSRDGAFIDDAIITNASVVPPTGITDLISTPASGAPVAAPGDFQGNGPYQYAIFRYKLKSGHNGTLPQDAVIVGGKEFTQTTAFTETALWITPDIDQDALSNIKAAILADLLTDTAIWQGRHNGRTKIWQRLHPFAATRYVAIFCENILGVNALRRINALVDSYNKVDGQSQTTAENLAHDPSLSEPERALYGHLRTILMVEKVTSTKCAFMQMEARLSGVYFVKQFNMIVDMCTGKHPHPQLTKALVDPHRGQGLHIKHACAQGLAARMSWTADKFKEQLKKYEDLAICVNALSTGFLVIAPPDFTSQVSKCGQAALSMVLAVVLKHFPDLKDICEQINQDIVMKLYGDSNARAAVAQIYPNALRTSKDGPDMMTRIRELYGQGQ